MDYPIPVSSEEIIALNQRPINGEIVATAIAGVIRIARAQGQSLDDLTAELMEEDTLLDQGQRYWLSKIVAQAWQNFP